MVNVWYHKKKKQFSFFYRCVHISFVRLSHKYDNIIELSIILEYYSEFLYAFSSSTVFPVSTLYDVDSLFKEKTALGRC